MALYKIKDFDANYRDHFDGSDIKDFGLYSGNDRIGSVDDILVDDEGRFRYLVINTGAWIFGKKVIIPIGQTRVDYNDRRVYANGLSKEQVENLPEYHSDMTQSYDYDYEERVRGVYRPTAGRADLRTDASAGLDSPTPLDEGYAESSVSQSAMNPAMGQGSLNRDVQPMAADYDRDTYRYDRDPNLYNLNDRDHQNLRLYEERLIANKRREKTGEVTVGKHVETEVAHTSVPIEKERVIVERVPGSGTATPGDADFREGEVARVEVYEEVPDIRKETYVREEVQVKKVVDRDTVNADEELRREELDINTQGNPVIEKRPDSLNR